MGTERELLQQVLDAYNNLDQSRFETIKALENAMLTLRARLSEKEQEPSDGATVSTKLKRLSDNAIAAAAGGRVDSESNARQVLFAEIDSLCVALDSPKPEKEQEPAAWHDKIIGMEISMDVSTGECDEGNRIFGTVYEVLIPECVSETETILAIEDGRNFTAPPQREWVGLTDEEMRVCFQKMYDQQASWPVYARAIEAKLRSKNE